jgi:membrane protein implicated in regulation of membrane protease activity
MYLTLVILGWLYVALMMAVAEATSSNGTLAGAVFTFLAFGVAPVSLVAWFMARPALRRAREKREADASGKPDGGGEAAAGAVPPVREEP